LIIWDRIFGTFQPEEEEPVYGLVHPLKTWSPIWGQIHSYVNIFHSLIATPKYSDKFKILYKPPGWNPKKDAVFEVPDVPQRSKVIKYDPYVNVITKIYVSFHFILILIGGVVSLLNASSAGLFHFSLYTICVVGSMEVMSIIMEGRRISWFWELGRLCGCWIFLWRIFISKGLLNFTYGLHIVVFISALFCLSQIRKSNEKVKGQ